MSLLSFITSPYLTDLAFVRVHALLRHACFGMSIVQNGHIIVLKKLFIAITCQFMSLQGDIVAPHRNIVH